MKTFFLLFPLFTAVFSLQSNSKDVNHNKPQPITMIFDSIKTNYDTLYFKDGADVTTPAPILLIKLSPKKTESPKIKDTVVIFPTNDFVIVSHKYCPTSSIDFILKAGDTAHIKYIQGVPFIDISNRKTKKFDLNYDYYKRKRYVLTEEMQTVDIVKHPDIYMYKRIVEGDKSLKDTTILKTFTPKLINELEDEKHWLDSLHQSALLSDEEFHFYNKRNKYSSLNLNLQNKTKDELINELKEYNDSLYRNEVTGFYQIYLFSVGISYINTFFPTLKGDKFVGLYDYMENQSDIIGKLSQDIRITILREILKHSAIKIRRKYFDKFLSTISDTTFINKLKKESKSLLNPDIEISNNVVLLSASGEKTTLTEVLKRLKGKVVYVDFWASWCVPCLQEMPKSEQLRKNPAYPNIAFVYIAINDKEKQWKAVWEKACLTNYKHNYLIINSENSSFIKKHKIGTIPRYMLFDKDGKLLDANAPRPSSDDINKILTEH